MLEMKYFVLKPRGSGPHAAASRQAMMAYATYIYPYDPDLSTDLHNWANTEEVNAEEIHEIEKSAGVEEKA